MKRDAPSRRNYKQSYDLKKEGTPPPSIYKSVLWLGDQSCIRSGCLWIRRSGLIEKHKGEAEFAAAAFWMRESFIYLFIYSFYFFQKFFRMGPVWRSSEGRLDRSACVHQGKRRGTSRFLHTSIKAKFLPSKLARFRVLGTWSVFPFRDAACLTLFDSLLWIGSGPKVWVHYWEVFRFH